MKIPTLLTALLLAGPWAKGDTYELYIVAGQSNTVGHNGNVNELTAAEQLPTDVDFRYWPHRDVDLTARPLRLQSTSLAGGGNSYEPEITLGRALADDAAETGRNMPCVFWQVALPNRLWRVFLEQSNTSE